SLLAVLGSWFKYARDHAFDFARCRARLFDAQGEQRKKRNPPMSNHYWPRLQLRRNGLARLALNPRRADRGSRFIFQRERKVDNSVAEIACGLPVIPGRALIGREESKIHFLKLFRANALDKAHFVANGFKLAEGFVVIEQAHVDGGEIPFAQNFGNLFSLERRRAHNGDAINIRATQISGRGRLRKGKLRSSSHGFCDASRYGGGAGGVLRWKIHCKRHSTPEAM